jgi:hypothetical protein
VGDYKAWEQLPDGGWVHKPAFLLQRIGERYIYPIEKLSPADKNGFMIMAVSCLMMETLESFYQGWGSTKNRSKECFDLFFKRQLRFQGIQNEGLAERFYYEVRCGILHLGETKSGWKVIRSGPMFDRGSLTLNGTAFHRQVALALKDYCNDLTTHPPGSSIRNNFDKKMKVVIANCE